MQSLGLYGSNNILIDGLSSLNSEMFHIIIYGSSNVNLFNMKISAPENSPNTDGIHVEHSSGVSITNSLIGTGDDCVSIGPGSSSLMIQNLTCGPGHGVSIGSLGWKLNEEGVQNVTVKSATFTRTQNGVRVKTWARPSNGFVKGLIFQHLFMIDVKNPIIIDQNYCPSHGNCPSQGSGVKISDVTYEDIRGTSATEVAVNLDCSKTQPCTGITAAEVNLSYQDKPANAFCDNAVGNVDDGEAQPSCCVRSKNWLYNF
ncbi:Pectin lyase-like superfamily protein [Perilla frutescens var. frutescens]|nr:Pectin lyase-like superfamily protein [Perilla frutescens var. frutescens]